MVRRDSSFAILIAAAVVTLFLVPAHGSAQDSTSVSCANPAVAPLEDVIRCARQGHAEAQYSLAFFYSFGLGVLEDDSEAVRWYRLAAEQGNAGAQIQLGGHYAAGYGVPEDDAEAVRWYRLAAEQGHVDAQFLLGVSYSSGVGVPEDLVYAYMWYNLSAAQGYELAQSNKDIIEQRMTREQIAEAQRLSREWIETHPQDGP